MESLRALDLHPAVSHFFRFCTGRQPQPRSPEAVAFKGLEIARCFYIEKHASPQHAIDGHRRRCRVRHRPRRPDSVWIPFWAAGVINGIGHYWGYRHWSTPDTSTNIVPIGILIGGEELHNNHHAFPTSAKLSSKWYEFDIGWLYIRVLEALGLARVKHVAPVPQFTVPKRVIDPETLQAVVRNRYDVLAKYAKSIKRIYNEEIGTLRRTSPEDACALEIVKPWLNLDEEMLRESDRAKLARSLPKSHALQTMVSMRRDLVALWGRSAASHEQLVRQLQEWCQRAEASGIAPLAEFSRQLRSYG
jgi:stearoyl-CoA desaturase (Delta-9 desaturase)